MNVVAVEQIFIRKKKREKRVIVIIDRVMSSIIEKYLQIFIKLNSYRTEWITINSEVFDSTNLQKQETRDRDIVGDCD